MHFIYPDIGTGYFPSVHHGIAQLVAVLKANGHEASLHHVRKEPKYNDIVFEVIRSKPDIVGFTVMSNQINYVELWSCWIKDYQFFTPIICGGVHATLNPDDVLSFHGVDAVCIGDGEQAVLDLANIEGHGVKFSIKNSLVEDMDTLPFPDYSLFDIGGMLEARNGKFAVIVSRGCPHNCYYCSNSALRQCLDGLGKYFRYRSVDNTIEMLSYYTGEYPVGGFSFSDDIFGLNKKWVLEFCEKYPQAVGLPFDCNLRVESATKELLEALKYAGCDMVEMGIESGSQWMRSEFLNRKMTNEQIVDAFDNAHKLGIKTRAYNMIGLPYETPAMARETLELNKRVKPDEVAVFYFYPYKGTRLYDVCEKEGFLTGKQSAGYVSESALSLPAFSAKELKKIHDEFYRYMISRRGWLYWLADSVLRLLTWGNEVRMIERAYMKCQPVLRSLGSK